MRFAHLLPYLGCTFAVGCFYGFSNFSLPLWLRVYIPSLVIISLLSNSRSFLGAFVSPVAGAWSDRVWAGWLGRRRPFLLVGGLTSALVVAVMPHVPRWPLTNWLGLDPGLTVLASLIFVLVINTISINMMDDIQKSMMADLTTEGAQRNRLASFAALADMGGNFSGLGVGALFSAIFVNQGVPDVAFAVVGGLVAIGVLITVLGIREPSPAVWAKERAQEAAELGSRLSPRILLNHYRGALVFGLVVFCYWAGVNAVLPLISLYVHDVLGASDAEAQWLPALLLLSTALLALPMGWLGTRFGKRRILAIGYTIMGLAALAGLLIATKEQGAVLFVLAGVGNAASVVLTIPLLADLVPRHHMGAAAGLLAAAGGLAAPFSSLVAGSLSDLYGPRAIFAVMAVMVLAGLVLLAGVRQPTHQPAAVPFITDIAEPLGAPEP